MSSSKLRRQIAWEAACLMYGRRESEYQRAKMKAARRICRGAVRPSDLPSNAEIRGEIQGLARSMAGKAPEGASAEELEQLLAHEHPDLVFDQAVAASEHRPDRFQVYESLLLPLEYVKENPRYHPEGDALYHSLQVFDLARDELPYDEEFLLAALLHDVGKAIEPIDHVAAALEALDGFLTTRANWLIQHHLEGGAVLDGAIGSRARRRLQQSDSYAELVLLAQCDRAGRQAGVEAPELHDALDYVRDLARTFGE